MLFQIESGEKIRWDHRRDFVPIGSQGGLNLESVISERARVLFGSMDGEHGPKRLNAGFALSLRGKNKSVAESARSMNVVSVSGVDPNVQTVAFLGAGIAAPRRLPLPGDLCSEIKTFFTPACPDICEKFLS